MKTLHYSIIAIFSIIFIFSNNGVFADNANSVEIQNIQVQPSIIKVGDSIKITATLVNNSTYPIFVGDIGSKDCQGPFFTIVFNDHVKVTEKEIACSYVALEERLDPGRKYTGTSPGLSFTYIATKSGTANATVTFPYEVKNQTDPNQSKIGQSVSKSFLFTILDNNTNVKLTGNHEIMPIIETPLKQFKSGISAQDVKCGVDLNLVIKSKDGSPACIKKISVERLVRQGWWAWNDKVGNTIVNTPEKRDFDSKNCALFETVSSIVGTNGFGRDDLPQDGITYPGKNLTGLVGQVIQFSIKPNSEGYITFTYDFNPYPGSNCKVTTKDAIAANNPAKPNISIPELIGSPDILRVDKNSVNTTIPPLGNTGDILVNLTSAENLNDHVTKVTYKIFAKPDAQLEKSYFIGFWWHSAVVITVGDSLYTGNAFTGSHYG